MNNDEDLFDVYHSFNALDILQWCNRMDFFSDRYISIDDCVRWIDISGNPWDRLDKVGGRCRNNLFDTYNS